MRVLYLANIRLPTEKAHGLQIVHMCEAFAQTGASVTLVVPRRTNSTELRGVHDLWQHYGVDRNFTVRRLPCLDLMPYADSGSAIEKATFAIETLTFTIALLAVLLFERADVYYSRDALSLLLLSIVKPRRRLIFEAHTLAKSQAGIFIQRGCVRRVGLVVAVTGKLAADLQARGARHTLVAHDGIRRERFAHLPDRLTARRELDLPPDAFIVGYVGQIHTMKMSKGVDILIDSIGLLPDIPMSLCLVGGPNSMADVLRDRWRDRGLPDDRFLFVGQVSAAKVPICLAAFDVSTMPLPWTEHFAYYASPLKLFEYMAVGQAIVASDLLAVREVVQSEESALLTAPGDPQALAAALGRLYNDPALRERLGSAAKAESELYTWDARARRILDALA
ncbi:MAG TPA: glycosyltransferase [Aggregatilineales bacterium]|nr:glycosyltransferase [Aggregatilineales bacterium]